MGYSIQVYIRESLRAAATCTAKNYLISTAMLGVVRQSSPKA